MESNVLIMAETALISLDSESLVSLYSKDFVFEDTSSGEILTDKEALRAYFDRLFSLPEVRFSDVTFFSCGDRGVGEWTWSGKSLQSGSDYAIRGVSIFVLGQNQIRSETIFYDPRSAYR
jgi:hypothetical protein